MKIKASKREFFKINHHLFQSSPWKYVMKEMKVACERGEDARGMYLQRKRLAVFEH